MPRTLKLALDFLLLAAVAVLLFAVYRYSE